MTLELRITRPAPQSAAARGTDGLTDEERAERVAHYRATFASKDETPAQRAAFLAWLRKSAA